MVAVGEGVGVDRCDGVADGGGVLDGLPPCEPSWLGAFFTWLSAAGANSATAGGDDWLASSATTPRVSVAATAIAVTTTPGPLTGRRGVGTATSISHAISRHRDSRTWRGSPARLAVVTSRFPGVAIDAADPRLIANLWCDLLGWVVL